MKAPIMQFPSVSLPYSICVITATIPSFPKLKSTPPPSFLKRETSYHEFHTLRAQIAIQNHATRNEAGCYAEDRERSPWNKASGDGLTQEYTPRRIISGIIALCRRPPEFAAGKERRRVLGGQGRPGGEQRAEEWFLISLKGSRLVGPVFPLGQNYDHPR
jgi:hypothetical protein